MHSSTSSSEAPADTSKYDRPLPGNSLGVAAMIAVIVAVSLMSGWEMYWRANDAIPSYRNSEGLWAIQRRRIDRGEGDKTVIVGSSRIFFNTQLDAWESESGQRPIQLGLEGTTPVPLIEALADDLDFTGRLLVGVAPGQEKKQRCAHAVHIGCRSHGGRAAPLFGGHVARAAEY